MSSTCGIKHSQISLYLIEYRIFHKISVSLRLHFFYILIEKTTKFNWARIFIKLVLCRGTWMYSFPLQWMFLKWDVSFLTERGIFFFGIIDYLWRWNFTFLANENFYSFHYENILKLSREILLDIIHDVRWFNLKKGR